MPITALITCIFVGYVLKPEALIEEIELTGKFTDFCHKFSNM